MNLNSIRKLISELNDKLTSVYRQQDEILHRHGHKISEFYALQKSIWMQFYPKTAGETPVKQKPAQDIQSPEMMSLYDDLLVLRIATAKPRKALLDCKSLARAYESERNKLLLERQELEKNPQSSLDL